MVKRDLLTILQSRASQFKAVLVTGPRQSGKTTLTRMAFPDKPYVSLESPDERMAAIEDPRSFLARFPDGAILDEAQRAPDIFSYMQQLHRGMRPNLYFWRDSSGLEIDLLHEDAASIKAFEIKSGATFAADWTGNLQKWCDLADMHQEIKTHLIYGGTKNFAFKGSHVSPWHQLPEL